jgi:hypothetical protein
VPRPARRAFFLATSPHPATQFSGLMLDTPPSPLALLLDQARRRSLRGVKRLARPLWMQALARRNADSQASVLDPAGPVLSLTSFGERLDQVHYMLESVAAGELRPSRLLLWVDEQRLAQGLPPTLQRLIARGLEVKGCIDVGPHTKYYPSVSQLQLDRPLVTADDDVLYPRRWLARLVAAARRAPQFIHAHRAHRFSFGPDGQPAPYAGWPPCRVTSPSHRHFVTGVAGVLYPPAMVQALREAGDGFLACCPRADDIWLNAVALRAGVQACQVTPFHPVLFELPGSRRGGLARHNVQGGGNDAQLLATYRPEELARLQQGA